MMGTFSQSNKTSEQEEEKKYPQAAKNKEKPPLSQGYAEN